MHEDRTTTDRRLRATRAASACGESVVGSGDVAFALPSAGAPGLAGAVPDRRRRRRRRGAAHRRVGGVAHFGLGHAVHPRGRRGWVHATSAHEAAPMFGTPRDVATNALRDSESVLRSGRRGRRRRRISRSACPTRTAAGRHSRPCLNVDGARSHGKVRDGTS